MRLILSRKGFDSSAGGCPSPIFPDGSLYPLPIPDPKSSISFEQLHYRDIPIGKLVTDLTRGRHTGAEGAHLDPDMHRGSLPRRRGWRPLLGQTGAAQGHLRRQCVSIGDLFLFFGLFRPVEMAGDRWRFVKGAPACHVLWGWMGIGEIVAVDELESGALPWARYHPHFTIGPDANNTLYIAGDRVNVAGEAKPLPGTGVFSRLHEQLVLTLPGSPRPSAWRLPTCFYPQPDRMPLTYHGSPWRWERGGGDHDGYCLLQSAARGQEFVLDMDQYPGAAPWLAGLISRHGK